MDSGYVHIPDPQLEVREWVGKSNGDRRAWQVSGVGAGLNLAYHRNKLSNLLHGVVERVFYRRVEGVLRRCPTPIAGIFDDRLGEFRAQLLGCLVSTLVYSRQEFVDCYHGRKRTIYQAAADSLTVEQLTRSDAFIRAFVKADKTSITAVPRIISPRSARYNVEVGKFLKPLEGPLCRAIGEVWGQISGNTKTVAKGLNSQQLGQLIYDKWCGFDDPVVIGLDAKRFDQHVAGEALEWEHSVYNRHFRNRKLEERLSWQLDNHVTALASDGRVRYVKHGSRMSGDMNTSSGNCLLMCAMVYAYVVSIGVKADLVNNGDDCLVFIERKHLQLFSGGLHTYFLEMGFDIVAEEPCYEMEHIEFCQCKPIRTGPAEWLMVRNPVKALTKDSLCNHEANGTDVVGRWCKAVSDAGTALSGGIPVFDSFYRMYGRNNTAKGQVTLPECGLTIMARGMNRRGMSVTQMARYSFYIAYGITPDEQVEIERCFDAMKAPSGLPSLVKRVEHLPDSFAKLLNHAL